MILSFPCHYDVCEMMASLSSGARTDERPDVSWSVSDNTNIVILTKMLERQVASSSAVEDHVRTHSRQRTCIDFGRKERRLVSGHLLILA
jgi:hypothetical protein